jgi:dihydrofolate reductase
LHNWAFSSEDPRNHEVAEESRKLGAVITGRTTYNHSIRYWGADGPTGEARVPTIIVSHSVPGDIPAGGVYTFVDNVNAAFEKAKAAAGDKDVLIHGGNTARQMIALGLVDEVFVHVVPVLFGSGTRLYEQVGGEHVTLETAEVIETREAIHLRFRVVK